MNLVMQTKQLKNAENRLKLKMKETKPLSKEWVLVWKAWGKVLQVSEWLRVGNTPTPQQQNDIDKICNA